MIPRQRWWWPALLTVASRAPPGPTLRRWCNADRVQGERGLEAGRARAMRHARSVVGGVRGRAAKPARAQISVSNQTLRTGAGEVHAGARVESAAPDRRSTRRSPRRHRCRGPSRRATAPVSPFHDTYTDLLLPANVIYEADVWGRIRNSVEANRTASSGDRGRSRAGQLEPSRGAGRGLIFCSADSIANASC